MLHYFLKINSITWQFLVEIDKTYIDVKVQLADTITHLDSLNQSQQLNEYGIGFTFQLTHLSGVKQTFFL